jgi:tetratricopeptide (TPR) repeat protein
MRMSLRGVAILACGWLMSACALYPGAADWNDPLTADEHLVLAYTYQQQGQLQPAAREYKAVLKSQPQHLSALLALGNIAFQNEEWTNAEEYYRRVLATDPHHAGAANNLAMVYLSTGSDLDEAERLARHALEQPTELRPYILETLATLYSRQGRWADAQTAVEEAEASGVATTALQTRLAELRRQIADAQHPLERLPRTAPLAEGTGQENNRL